MRALIVGRFQPFHNGHMQSIKHVLDEFEDVIIGIGSAQYSHTPNNPFTGGERHLMISKALFEEGVENFFLVPIQDVNQYGLWVAHVQLIVPPFDAIFSNNPLTLRLFSERGYDARPLPMYDRKKYSGSAIRDMIVKDEPWEELVPNATAEVLKQFDGVNRLKDLCEPIEGEGSVE